MTELLEPTAAGVAGLPVDEVVAALRSRLVSHDGGPVGVVALGARGVQDDPADAVRAQASVHVTGEAVLVGPWGGADGACGQCLGIRWQRLRTRSEREALEHGKVPEPLGSWPVLTDFLVAAVQAQVWLAQARQPEPSPWGSGWQRPADLRQRQVTRIDLETLGLLTVPVLREPTCPSCGPDGVDDPLAAGDLAEQPKPRPDVYRTRGIGDLDLPSAALANPVAGVIGTKTWLNHLSPTTAPVAGGGFVRGYAGLVDVTWSGQGASYDRSRTLAFVEGLERYAGTHRRHGREVVVASYDDVRDHAVHPLSCGDYDPATYAEESLLDPFDPSRPIPWVWGRSLTHDRAVLVPSRLVYYSAGVAADNFVFECSNGCATGSSREEATLFGLLELLERDAFLLAWYGGLDLPRIDLDDLDDPRISAMRARAGLLGYDLHVLDNRIDIDVPVITSVAVRPDGSMGTLSLAAGASLDPREAVEAALSETLTYLPHLPNQAREGEAELRAMMADYGLVRHLTDHARMYGMPEMGVHTRRYVAPRSSTTFGAAFGAHLDRPGRTDLREDVADVVDRIAAAGHEVVVVDQTSPEQAAAGLHTVATLAPGLLPIDFGWNRQRALRMPRLRTAPARAGLVDHVLTDEELVRVPHPFP
ncbi:TOMM precursor leader peptide-binding protein [Nocardioides dongxiaopingii]|uniref:TOMM precursor leader peptide-binding protein n=1 Tax=Nocardioides dongxiaopingii TaxID=2576036 RepID=UPI0010C76496|nr:TOMM precursor leader peptide-binding protein [Nocardioides dongxiaopingii]